MKNFINYPINILAILLATYLFGFPIHASSVTSQKMLIGPQQTRALLFETQQLACPSPLVILIPGSGAQGPEVMLPASVTAHGQDYPFFVEIAQSLVQGGVRALALGKPGVDYFQGWDPKTFFYDRILTQNLTWSQWLHTVYQAVEQAQKLPCVDPSKIVLLGHSEGTQVAVDVATQYAPVINGILLMGFAGENMQQRVDWQVFKREIDYFVVTDVDQNKDGWVDRAEADQWPEFVWQWGDKARVSVETIEKTFRSSPPRVNIIETLKSIPLYGQGVYQRPPIYHQTAYLDIPVWALTGALDLQTPSWEAIELAHHCQSLQKRNCWVTIWPEVGHGFSFLRKPRQHILLDMTLGPIDKDVLEYLKSWARSL